MNKQYTQHQKFMRQALELAVRARGKTNPNPLVGALVVKQGEVISQGYHQRAGRDHAEIIALRRAGKKAKGASLYVTLEPCSQYSRTPPCVYAIKESGIKKVIFAMHDVNPQNRRKAKPFLKKNGIKVVSGILEKEARKINRVFIKYITRNLPFVTVKIAQSLDGKIATWAGDSHWISSGSSRARVHRLRSEVDAICVGANTLLRDNPLLSARSQKGTLYSKQPQKIVIDGSTKISPRAKIFSRLSPGPVVIATTRNLSAYKRLESSKKNVYIMKVAQSGKRVNLKELFRALANEGIAHVLIEGGGEIIASALRERLVDEMIVFIAPKIIGGRDARTSVEGEGVRLIKDAIRLKEIRVSQTASDLVIEGVPV